MNYEIKLDINIKAPIEVVWKELVNFEVYNSWNPVFASIIGDFKVNSKLKNDMKLKALLLEINEEKSFKWLMTIGPKFLFNSIHSFELEKIDENTTKFIQTETFAVMGVKKFWKKMKLATEQGYDYMNMALKYKCENLMKKIEKKKKTNENCYFNRFILWFNFKH